MPPQLQQCLQIICAALQVDALPVSEVTLIEQWQALPGFTPERLQQLITERQKGGRKVTSARYFDAAVRESFREWAPAKERVRLLSERPWEEYLAHHRGVYGALSAGHIDALRDRWETERRERGLLVEMTDETPVGPAGVRPGTAIGRPFPSAPGGA